MADLKPIACALPDGRVAVYIGATYSYLPREKAVELIAQLHEATGDAPHTERDARELALWRKEADLAGQLDAHPLARSVAAKLKARVAMQLSALEQAHG